MGRKHILNRDFPGALVCCNRETQEMLELKCDRCGQELREPGGARVQSADEPGLDRREISRLRGMLARGVGDAEDRRHQAVLGKSLP